MEVLERFEGRPACVGGDRDRPCGVRRQRDEPAGVAEDEPDVRVPAHHPVAHEQVSGAGGVEQEIGRERDDPVDRRARELGGMDEDDRSAVLQRAEQRVLATGAEIHAPIVG
ncbi:MAG TPA: hypothetical protein VNR42_07680 [Solirubrobacteraceae bacterium]|nr:hypothetical protein [Solirubrobacteraceae bacterium]